MDKQELTRLKELSEKATPGEWRADRYVILSPKGHTLGRTYAISENCIQRMEVVDSYDNTAFIAAANPQTVLALIDDLVKTKDALAHCRDKNSQLEKEADWLAEKLVVAQAETVEDIKPPSTMRNAARKAVEEANG